jgi:hypothetical protein
MDIRDVLPNRQKFRDLDGEIRKLGEKVASIRREINDTSTFGNVFKEVESLMKQPESELRSHADRLRESLTNQRENVLRSSADQLEKLRETAGSLWHGVDSLKSGRFQQTIVSTFGAPTKQRLSSQLEAVIEQIRGARMAAVYLENYRNFESNKTSLPGTANPDPNGPWDHNRQGDPVAPNNLVQYIGYTQLFAAAKQDFERQYAELQGLVESRASGQPWSEEDQYFSALTAKILQTIGTLETRIEKLHTIGLDAEIKSVASISTAIKELNESVASIRKNIDDTSPVGNVFHEIENLRDDRKDQLRAFERKLQDARDTAKELLKRVNSLPARTGELLGEMSPEADTQTRHRLSSDLQAVVENIRCATMAAVYPAKYQEIQGSETIRDLPTTIQSNRLEDPKHNIQIFQPELQDLERQHKELQGFVESRDPGQPLGEEDKHFLALTERIPPLIEILKRHIEEPQREQRELRPRETQSEPNLPAADQAQVLRLRAQSEPAIGSPVVWRH